MNHNLVRNLSLLILSDDLGIDKRAFDALKELLTRSANDDILNEVVAAYDRYYLPATSSLYKF